MWELLPCIWQFDLILFKKGGDLRLFVVVVAGYGNTTIPVSVWSWTKTNDLAWLHVRSPRREQAPPLWAARGSQSSSGESARTSRWCVMAHDWTADVSPPGHSVFCLCV